MFTIFGKFSILSSKELNAIDKKIVDLETKKDDAIFKLMEKTQGGAKIQWDNWNNEQLKELSKELQQVLECRKKRNQESCLTQFLLTLENTIDAFSEGNEQCERFKITLCEHRRALKNTFSTLSSEDEDFKAMIEKAEQVTAKRKMYAG